MFILSGFLSNAKRLASITKVSKQSFFAFLVLLNSLKGVLRCFSSFFLIFLNRSCLLVFPQPLWRTTQVANFCNFAFPWFFLAFGGRSMANIRRSMVSMRRSMVVNMGRSMVTTTPATTTRPGWRIWSAWFKDMICVVFTKAYFCRERPFWEKWPLDGLNIWSASLCCGLRIWSAYPNRLTEI